MKELTAHQKLDIVIDIANKIANEITTTFGDIVVLNHFIANQLENILK
jgi:hypothetical protein